MVAGEAEARAPAFIKSPVETGLRVGEGAWLTFAVFAKVGRDAGQALYRDAVSALFSVGAAT
jgi:hypothetical protein